MFLSSTKIQHYRTDPLWKGLRRSGGQISCSNSSMWDETACSLVQSSCWWVFSKAGASAAFLNNCPNIWLISWGGGKFPNISSEFPVLQLLSVASHPWQLYSWGDSSSFFAKPPYQVTGNRNNPALLILKLKKPSLSASPYVQHLLQPSTCLGDPPPDPFQYASGMSPKLHTVIQT